MVGFTYHNDPLELCSTHDFSRLNTLRVSFLPYGQKRRCILRTLAQSCAKRIFTRKNVTQSPPPHLVKAKGGQKRPVLPFHCILPDLFFPSPQKNKASSRNASWVSIGTT
jgi:hypothetical protein